MAEPRPWTWQPYDGPDPRGRWAQSSYAWVIGRGDSLPDSTGIFVDRVHGSLDPAVTMPEAERIADLLNGSDEKVAALVAERDRYKAALESVIATAGPLDATAPEIRLDFIVDHAREALDGGSGE